MSTIRSAMALGIVCGIGTRYGWGNALVSVAVLGFLVWVLRVARSAPTMFSLNGCERTKGRVRRLAEWIVCIAAASLESEGARDAALEASVAIDDMTEDGCGPFACVASAMWIAVRIGRTARTRRPRSTPSFDERKAPGKRSWLREALARMSPRAWRTILEFVAQAVIPAGLAFTANVVLQHWIGSDWSRALAIAAALGFLSGAALLLRALFLFGLFRSGRRASAPFRAPPHRDGGLGG